MARERSVRLPQFKQDIAAVVMGYTTSERVGILAHRPAPIQAQYLGFAGTMGAEFIDYIIADPHILLFDRQAYCTERIVHLPDCYLVNDRTRVIAPEGPTRESVGLPENSFVFCEVKRLNSLGARGIRRFNYDTRDRQKAPEIAPLFNAFQRAGPRPENSFLYLLGHIVLASIQASSAP